MAVSAASGDSAVIEDPIRVIRIEGNDALKGNVHAQLRPAAPITFLAPKRKDPNPTSSIRAALRKTQPPRAPRAVSCSSSWPPVIRTGSGARGSGRRSGG